MIYPLSDNSWVSLAHLVPKKGGITIVHNENNELILTRTIIGKRMCVDYRKLNKVTRNDHFHLFFVDQMLDCLARHEYRCFLDDNLGHNKIATAP